jgi:hypothetical protein
MYVHFICPEFKFALAGHTEPNAKTAVKRRGVGIFSITPTKTRSAPHKKHEDMKIDWRFLYFCWHNGLGMAATSTVPGFAL